MNHSDVAATEADEPDDPGSGAGMLGVVLAGRYRIVAGMARGGFGLIYRAWDLEDSRYAVVKIPLVGCSLVRFKREMALLERIDHDHVVPIRASGVHCRWPFYVMPHLAGGDLSKRRPRIRGERIPAHASTLHSWLPAIASALDHIHGRGFLHRDVKPSNILFDGDGKPYLGDFGLARIQREAREEGDGETITVGAQALGTPDYICPQVCATWTFTDDPRSDQYGLAVVVYELLSGRMPTTGSSVPMKLSAAIDQLPRSLGGLCPELPASLCEAVHRSLAKRPEDRFGTCGEFVACALADVPDLGTSLKRRLTCPGCGVLLVVEDRQLGKECRCPNRKCRCIVTATREPALVLPADADPGALVPRAPTATLEPASPSEPPGWRRLVAWLRRHAAAIIVTVASVVVTVALLLRTPVVPVRVPADRPAAPAAEAPAVAAIPAPVDPLPETDAAPVAIDRSWPAAEPLIPEIALATVDDLVGVPGASFMPEEDAGQAPPREIGPAMPPGDLAAICQKYVRNLTAYEQVREECRANGEKIEQKTAERRLITTRGNQVTDQINAAKTAGGLALATQDKAALEAADKLTRNWEFNRTTLQAQEQALTSEIRELGESISRQWPRLQSTCIAMIDELPDMLRSADCFERSGSTPASRDVVRAWIESAAQDLPWDERIVREDPVPMEDGRGVETGGLGGGDGASGCMKYPLLLSITKIHLDLQEGERGAAGTVVDQALRVIRWVEIDGPGMRLGLPPYRQVELMWPVRCAIAYARYLLEITEQAGVAGAEGLSSPPEKRANDIRQILTLHKDKSIVNHPVAMAMEGLCDRVEGDCSGADKSYRGFLRGRGTKRPKPSGRRAPLPDPRIGEALERALVGEAAWFFAAAPGRWRDPAIARELVDELVPDDDSVSWLGWRAKAALAAEEGDWDTALRCLGRAVDQGPRIFGEELERQRQAYLEGRSYRIESSPRGR